jgi:hypothetical protein
MNTRRTPSLSLVALLALALVAGPLLPAFAAPAPADGGTDKVAAHAHHGDEAGAAQSGASSDEVPASCTQHETCAFQCCAACAHCATATLDAPLAVSTDFKSLQLPIVPATFLVLPPAGPIRPPQIARR